VIKPQGTGCGHGIEFFFGDESREEIQSKVQEALRSVAANYNLECGGLPYTICEFLDTATVCPEAGQKQHMVGHKFEIRIVVYRDGDELRAFPSIAKVARAAFDPEDHHPDKAALINNITTSAKETAQSGAEFMLPLCCSETLRLLRISEAELQELCKACTNFIRFVLDQVQDQPSLFGLPHDLQSKSWLCQP
jgi:intracellular sulfur oxidation DsrE/DsrF family protein